MRKLIRKWLGITAIAKHINQVEEIGAFKRISDGSTELDHTIRHSFETRIKPLL